MDLTATNSPRPGAVAGALPQSEALHRDAALNAIENRVRDAGPPLTWANLRADTAAKIVPIAALAILMVVANAMRCIGLEHHPDQAVDVTLICAGVLVLLPPVACAWDVLRRLHQGPDQARAELFKALTCYAPPLDSAAWSELAEAVRQQGDRFDPAPFPRWLAAERRALADKSRPPSPDVEAARRAFLATRIER